MHDCLVPITAWIGNIFDSIRRTDKIPGRVRAVDMRNLLLVLPFLLHNLLEEEVAEYNSTHIFDPIVDHSCVFVTVLEEYSGPRRPGTLKRLLIVLRPLISFVLHRLLR